MTALAENKRFSTITTGQEFETRYNHIDFEISQEDNLIPFSTEVGAIAKDRISSVEKQDAQTNEDVVLSEVEGVIDRINDDTVRVKLYPNNNYANFPPVIFESKGIIKQGQHIKYMIKKDKEGYRYQQIKAIENIKPHPAKDDLLSLLDDISYKHD